MLLHHVVIAIRYQRTYQVATKCQAGGVIVALLPGALISRSLMLRSAILLMCMVALVRFGWPERRVGEPPPRRNAAHTALFPEQHAYLTCVELQQIAHPQLQCLVHPIVRLLFPAHVLCEHVQRAASS
jgi:hypothetical protein